MTVFKPFTLSTFCCVCCLNISKAAGTSKKTKAYIVSTFWILILLPYAHYREHSSTQCRPRLFTCVACGPVLVRLIVTAKLFFNSRMINVISFFPGLNLFRNIATTRPFFISHFDHGSVALSFHLIFGLLLKRWFSVEFEFPMT